MDHPPVTTTHSIRDFLYDIPVKLRNFSERGICLESFKHIHLRGKQDPCPLDIRDPQMLYMDRSHTNIPGERGWLPVR